MLYLNGHGSNQNLVEMAARLVIIEHPEVLAAAAFYLTSQEGYGRGRRAYGSPRSEAWRHACELETSIYLAIDPDAVAMDKAVDEQATPTASTPGDWADGPLPLMPWWSSFSRTGVQGSPTLATAEKGGRSWTRPSRSA